MLTRLKVYGFKNLMDVDVRFGPFTCIAGVNGVGKLNLFDAIMFLSELAEKPLTEAALSVRSEGGRAADIRSLFHRVGDDYDEKMSFETEMVVPAEGTDDLGQLARASITFLRYSLILAYRSDDSPRGLGSLEIVKEELVHINQRDAYDHLGFDHSSQWRKSAVRGKGRRGRQGEHGEQGVPFISTLADSGGVTKVRLHQEGHAGRPSERLAATLPRTILSAVNATESPTVLLARQEMRSWRLLQLEPSAMRKPDEFTAPTRLEADGSHLAATLYSLARGVGRNGHEDGEGEAAVYARIANQLAELIDDVRNVSIDRDDRRELLTLVVTGRDGTAHAARALSDGTLRFLALTVLGEQPEAPGLLCLEEPENGIHPARIPAMLRLLQQIATDPDEPIGPDNPLRQVIVNTHSPSVVKQVPGDSLVVAQLRDTVDVHGRHYRRVTFRGLEGTWRQESGGEPAVSLGTLVAYLNPDVRDEDWPSNGKTAVPTRRRRVMDHPSFQPLLPSLFADA